MQIYDRTRQGEKLYSVNYTEDGYLLEQNFTIWERPSAIRQTLHFLEVRNGNNWKVQSVKEKDFVTGKLKEVRL